MGVSKKLLVASVFDAEEGESKRITNSKDFRKLRAPSFPIRWPALAFLSEEGNLKSALLRLRVIEKKANDGLLTGLNPRLKQ